LKKLLKLKDWLTVPDAARHLSILFGEDVTEADVLRFALDGRLKLSVDFVNHATARCGKIIPLAEAEIKKIPALHGDGVIGVVKNGFYLEDDKVFSFSGDTVVSIDGIWDLPMLGAERLDVEHKYQFLTGGPSVELTNLTGPLVNRADRTWSLIVERFSNKNHLKSPRNHPDNYHPAGALPSDAVFVVRRSALQDLEALISEPQPSMERPVESKERATLLVIIAALAKLAKVDIAKPSKAAVAIQTQIRLMGAHMGVRTIEIHLNRIPDALERKGAED